MYVILFIKGNLQVTTLVFSKAISYLDANFYSETGQIFSIPSFRVSDKIYEYDVSTLPHGTYMIQWKDQGSGNQKALKFVKI